MIDYFIHFINKHFHLLRINDTSTVKHRPDFMDKFRNLSGIHPRLPGNPLERTFVIRHFLYIHLNFPPQLFAVNIIKSRMVIIVRYKAQRSGWCASR